MSFVGVSRFGATDDDIYTLPSFFTSSALLGLDARFSAACNRVKRPAVGPQKRGRADRDGRSFCPLLVLLRLDLLDTTAKTFGGHAMPFSTQFTRIQLCTCFSYHLFSLPLPRVFECLFKRFFCCSGVSYRHLPFFHKLTFTPVVRSAPTRRCTRRTGTSTQCCRHRASGPRRPSKGNPPSGT